MADVVRDAILEALALLGVRWAERVRERSVEDWHAALDVTSAQFKLLEQKNFACGHFGVEIELVVRVLLNVQPPDAVLRMETQHVVSYQIFMGD